MTTITPGQEKLALKEEFKKLHPKLVLISDWKRKLVKHFPEFNNPKYRIYMYNVVKGNSSAEHRLVEACKFIIKQYYTITPKNI